MKFVVITVVLEFVFIFKISCDEYMGEFVSWYPSLESYKLYPRLGSCYEIYGHNETVTPFICQRPLDPKKHSCILIHLITAERYCLGLKTPTNEVVQLLCENSKEKLLSYHLDEELNNCFNVSRPDRSHKEVCQQKFDNFSIGITTPDNFTILFDSYFCSTSTNNEERETYSNFISTYSFHTETKSCYKIYNEHQKISPYTCLNEDVLDACVEELPRVESCEGITTQNNETIVLQCTNNNVTIKTGNCLNVYTANNTVHVACQKKVEDRCIGITTPSNLTVLLECYFCDKPGIKHISYNEEQQRKYRKFIQTYLSDEYLGKHSYLTQFEFKTFKSEYARSTSSAYGYWLPGSDCYGVTLDSNETIIIDCISKLKSKTVKSGCFRIINKIKKPQQEQVACTKILNDTCVGIKTPSNWTVVLACYPQRTNVTNRHDTEREEYAGISADQFRLYPGVGDCYEFYSSEEVNAYGCRKSANPKNYSCIRWLPKEKHCLGLTTPANETIEFLCGDSQEEVLTYKTFSTIKNCFSIYSSNNRSGKICQQKFGNYSIGLTTPSNYSILLDSFFCPAYKTSEQIQEYKEFIGNFTFNPSVRNCYKIYTPDQYVSPYSCLSNEVSDACVHLIENTNCMGITTQNNETIVLECPDDKSATNETGCFKIYTSEDKVRRVCQKQIEERCVGIVTPSNLTVLLECHTCLSTRGGSDLPIYSDGYRKIYRSFVEYALFVFSQNSYALENKTTLSVYNPHQDIKFDDCHNEMKNYDIHILHGHGNCRGITLENLETVVLGCPNELPEKNGCYDVFSPVYGDNRNEIIGPDQKVAKICVKILNEWCVGVITPRNWTIPLSCMEGPESACTLGNDVL